MYIFQRVFYLSLQVENTKTKKKIYRKHIVDLLVVTLPSLPCTGLNKQMFSFKNSFHIPVYGTFNQTMLS
jgi:hypothetical protein